MVNIEIRGIIALYEDIELSYCELQKERRKLKKLNLLIKYLKNYRNFITKLPKAPIDELKELRKLVLYLHHSKEVDELVKIIDKLLKGEEWTIKE